MSLTSRIQALTAYANEVTGESDTTLADAVATLAEGYGSGSEVFFTPNGKMYAKEYIMDSSTGSAAPDLNKAINLEIFSTGGRTTIGNCIYDCTNLKEFYAPNVSEFNTAYIIRQQGVSASNFETVVLGSVGHPVTKIGNYRWRYGNHATTLNLTIYVDYENVADISTDITQYASGHASPSGSTVNIIYRSSVTGEVLS